jgi:phage-related protein
VDLSQHLVFLISPIGLVIGAVVALGAAFVAAMIKNEAFREKVLQVFQSVKATVSSFYFGSRSKASVIRQPCWR